MKRSCITYLLLVFVSTLLGPGSARPPGTHAAAVASGTERHPPISASQNLPGARPTQEFDRRGRPLYKAGELLVKFRPGVRPETTAGLHRMLGIREIRRIERFRLHKVLLPPGLDEAAARRAYGASGLVAYVERNALRYPQKTPGDPYYSQQWALPKILAPQAWDITTGSPEVVIAVIDTGTALTHPDLAANLWQNPAEAAGAAGVDDDGNGFVDDRFGYDFADQDADPTDVDGHGTHVAGTIAAVADNGLGVAGLMWQARIMSLKVQADGEEAMATDAVIASIAYALDNGARIVNCSFGGESFSQNEYDAFQSLAAQGVLAVCAAGNDTLDTDVAGQENYPGGFDLDNILAVAATDAEDGLASFSNFGAASVDLAAPGTTIQSTVPVVVSTEARVTVQPDGAPLEFSAVGLTYAGTTGVNGVAGVLVDCGLGYPNQFPAGVAGNLALIQRGTLYFSEKVTNARTAGAIGVVIYNNEDSPLAFTLGTPGDWLPAVAVTQADGAQLLTQVGRIATIYNVPSGEEAYTLMSGTSMAAPHATALAGLVLAVDPSLSYGALKQLLMASADPLAALAGKTVSGGRINALQTLVTALGPGDLSCDGRIGIADVVIALQVVAGLAPAVCTGPAGTDVDADGRVGLAETHYLLQRVAGLR